MYACAFVCRFTERADYQSPTPSGGSSAKFPYTARTGGSTWGIILIGSAKKFAKKSLGVMINEVHPCISFKQLCFYMYMKICRDGPH